MECASAGGVGNPVEDEGEQEESDDMEGLVIWLELRRHRRGVAVRKKAYVRR